METLFAALGFCAALSLRAQTTAFTYQGQLCSGGTPATGRFDFRFTLHGTALGGQAVAGPLTNAAVGVTSGVFVAGLDFGPEAFTGADRWLEIGVREAGTGAFTTLAPRQALTPLLPPNSMVPFRRHCCRREC